MKIFPSRHPLSLSRPRAFASSSQNGFALVAVMALLALLLILLLSISTVTHVETRTTASNKNVQVARQNAIIGLQTAIGELQKYAGKDQAVTFPATTFYPTKDVNLPTATAPRYGRGDLYDNGTYGYRKFAQTSTSRSYLTKVETYLTATERESWDSALKDYWNAGRNPRWTGIMDSSYRVDAATNPNAAPTALPRQAAWETATPKFGEFKRDQLPAWIISGNEFFTINQGTDTVYPAGYQTPDTPLPNPDQDDTVVYLVGDTSAGRGKADAEIGQPHKYDQNITIVESADGLDGRVKAVKQEIKAANAEGTEKKTGHYAYWVGDESTKANFGIYNPHTDERGITNDDAKNRLCLQVPQRIGWENLDGFGPMKEEQIPVNTKKLENITTSREVGLLTTSSTSQTIEATRRNFHSLTAFSKSLQTDTALGGLKRDLSPYISKGGSAPTSDGYIADKSLYNATDPRFAAWGGTNNGFPKTNTTLPQWSELRDWANETNLNPVVTRVSLYQGVSCDVDGKYGSAGTIMLHWIPNIAIWNPYDKPIPGGTFTLEVFIHPGITGFCVAREANSATPQTLIKMLNEYDPEAKWTYIDSKVKFCPNGVGDADTANYKEILATAKTKNLKALYSPKDTPSDFTSDAWGIIYCKLEPAGFGWNKTSPADMYFWDGAPNNSDKQDFIWNFQPHNATLPQIEVQDSSETLEKLTTMDGVREMIRPIKFTISIQKLESGQARIFSIDAKNSKLWDGSSAIPLVNTMPASQLGSLFYPIAKIKGIAKVKEDNNNKDDDSERLKYSMVNDPNRTRLSPGISFSNAKGTIAESTQLGYYGWWKVVFGSGDDAGYTRSNMTTSWRYLIETQDFIANRPKGATDTDISQVSVDRDGDRKKDYKDELGFWHFNTVWFQPLIGTEDINGTPQSGNSIAKTAEGGVERWTFLQRFPAFSRFNFHARSLSAHPLIDAKKDPYGPNNEDNFNGLASFRESRAQNIKKWDLDQYDGSNSDLAYTMLTGSEKISAKNVGGKLLNTYLGGTEFDVRLGKPPEGLLLSLGQFQQANLSYYWWEPASPIGNSFAPIYVDREAIAGIHSRKVDLRAAGGKIFNDKIGNNSENQLLDLSYVLNENLWDRYFLSSIPAAMTATTDLSNARHRVRDGSEPTDPELQAPDTAAAHLLNVGALNVNSTSVEAWKGLLTAFRGLTLGTGQEPSSVPIARTLAPIESAVKFTEDIAANKQNQQTISANSPTNKNYKTALSGFRYLTDKMIEMLAERIVDEVRLRGPFLSLADFVNRRLVPPSGSNDTGSVWYQARQSSGLGDADPNVGVVYGHIDQSYAPFYGLSGLSGTLQRAIQVSGINGGVNYADLTSDSYPTDDRIYRIRRKSKNNAPSDNDADHYADLFTTHSQDPAMRLHLDSEHIAGAPVGEAGQLFDGTAALITQGDLLAMIGPALTPRGDTFVVRTYGDVLANDEKKVLARAYLEAVVQRTSDPVKAADGAAGAAKWNPTDEFGRKFKVISMRWLNEEEI